MVNARDRARGVGRRDGFTGGRARVKRRRERKPRQRRAQPAEARAREGVQPGLVLVYRRALALGLTARRATGRGCRRRRRLARFRRLFDRCRP